MKKSLFLLCVVILAVACAAPPTNNSVVAPDDSTNRSAASTAAPSEADLIAREKEVWDTLKKKDYDAFGNMLATDYLEVSSDGVYDKAGIVTHLKDLEFTEATFSDWKMIPIDKDAALLMYNVNVKGKFKGKDLPPGPSRASSLWANRAGKWQPVFFQETMVRTSPPPAPPAATTSPSPAAKVADAATLADPIEREKAIWDALKRRDYDAFAAMLDEKQVLVTADGVYDKAGTLNGVKMFDASKAELSEFKVLKINDDAIVVNYLVSLPGPKPSSERDSSLWVKRGDKWLALFHQDSTVTPGEAAAKPAK